MPISPSPWYNNSPISRPIIPPAPESKGSHDTEICILNRQHVDSKTNKKAIISLFKKSKQKEIKSFMKTEKISIRDKNDLDKLFTFFKKDLML